MRNKIRLLLGGVLFLAFAITAGYWWSLPRLVSYTPADGSRDVSASAPIQITFSRRMDLASIQERLTLQPRIPGDFSWQGSTLVFTPQDPWPAGAAVKVSLAAGSRAAAFPALTLSQEVNWSFAARQPRLVYLFPADGPANIYLLNPFTGESEALTDSPGGVQDFSVSAGGNEIYYSVRSIQGGSEIYRLDLAELTQASGSATAVPTRGLPTPKLVFTCLQAACRYPAISPDGSFLAYERTAFFEKDQPKYPQVWVVKLPIADPTAPEPAPSRAGEGLHQTVQPSWSPDDLLTFYDTNTAAFVFLDPLSSQQTLFPNQTGQPGAWHPGGKMYLAPEINFLDANTSSTLTDLQALANSHLILFDRSTGQTQDLTPEEGMEDTSPAFSPDGVYLVFARKFLDLNRWTPGRQAWLLRLDNLQARPLTSEPYYNHFEFSWSPLGDRLAYVRFNQA
ncbi:MAG: PD40 domain-containing protein, partial [Anaerolineales bacterium]|nr:PD40 domain-containing protein [Anaerolineales bacterium]